MGFTLTGFHNQNPAIKAGFYNFQKYYKIYQCVIYAIA